MLSLSFSSFIKWAANAGFFYVGWLVCMHQATGDYPYLGPLLVFAILVYHFFVNGLLLPDVILCITLGLFGTLVDSLYVMIGMLSYQGGYAEFPHLAPLWITSLWSLYAISINHSLKWLNYHLLLAALMGAMGAVSSYLAGVKLAAVSLLWGDILPLVIIGAIWSIVVPASLKWSALLNHKWS